LLPGGAGRAARRHRKRPGGGSGVHPDRPHGPCRRRARKGGPQRRAAPRRRDGRRGGGGMSGEVSTPSRSTAAPRASSVSAPESELEGALRVLRLPTLGVVLTLLRIARCLSQEEWALAAGVRPESISSSEHSKLRPSIRMIHRLSGALGYPVAALEFAQDFLDGLARLAAGRANPVEV